MKIFLMAIAALVAGVGVCTLIGAWLPREHSATRSAVFRASAAALHAVVRDFAAAPQWRTGVQNVELLPSEAGQPRHRETSAHGVVTYRVLADLPGERLVVEIADADLPWGGRWTYEFAPEGTGARVRITEVGFVKNPLFRFLARHVFGHTATMDQYLRDLGRKFGETIQPQS
jgi:hypothetical protein